MSDPERYRWTFNEWREHAVSMEVDRDRWKAEAMAARELLAADGMAHGVVYWHYEGGSEYWREARTKYAAARAACEAGEGRE